MNVIIIEDEALARENLKALFKEIEEAFDSEEEDQTITVVGEASSIEESVHLLKKTNCDLIFLDIELSDGNAFSIFDLVEVATPIIFTTAYNEYALKAFELNSIDYLLKPIAKSSLLKAIDKYKNLIGQNQPQEIEANLNALLKTIKSEASTSASNILVKTKDGYLPVKTNDFAFIYTENGIISGVTFVGKVHFLSDGMDKIMSRLDPYLFFRINRQIIINRQAITELSNWFGNKLLIHTKSDSEIEIIVGKGKAKAFKEWLEN